MNDATRAPQKPLTTVLKQAERQPSSKISSPTLTRGHIDIVGHSGDTDNKCICRTLGESDKCLDTFPGLKKNCQISQVVIKLAGLIGRQIARDEFQHMARASTEAREP